MTDIIDAIDMTAVVESQGVSINLSETRNADLTILGPTDSDKVSSGETYEITVKGKDGIATSESTFYVDAAALEAVVDND